MGSRGVTYYQNPEKLFDLGVGFCVCEMMMIKVQSLKNHLEVLNVIMYFTESRGRVVHWH